jgi:hypothetical protein
MKYAVEMGSGAIIYSYIPHFLNTDSGIQNLIGRIHRDRDRQLGDVISFFYFLKIKEAG